MKIWKTVTVLVACLVLVSLAACGAFGDSSQEETGPQLVEVRRGDLTVSVSGNGNIEAVNEVTLVFGTNGRIDKIIVDEGDEVAKGDVLARLDISPLELALTQAQAALSQAQLDQTRAGIAQTQAQATLTQAQVAQTQARAARTQAQLALDTAEDNLDDAYDYLRWAKRTFETMDAALETAKVSFETAELEFEIAETQLAAAELQVKATELQVEIANSQLEVIGAQAEVADLQLDAARQAAEEAQKQLDNATLTAPFNGAIAAIDVNEGDSISTATPIAHIIDLSSIELKIEVDEIDIPSVELHQRAIIDLDALPKLQLEGRVNSISLVPVMEAGLVSYDVTISLDIAESPDIRIGMSATADIIIDERSNVLLIPDRAIKQDNQGNSVVMVLTGDQSQQREVITGISDGLETEIVNGLEEGETIIIESRSESNSTGQGGFPFSG